MTDQENQPADKASLTSSEQVLRRRAEAIFQGKVAQSPELLEAMSPDAILRMLPELRVRQIELELQNEELRRTQGELEAAQKRYFDLYDMAPAGYCTVSKTGLILEANLTASTLLGVARGALVKQRISRFILKADRNIFYLRGKQLIDTGEAQSCELRMVKRDGTQFWASLAGTAAPDADGGHVLRVVLNEVTERKRTEEALGMAALVYQYSFEAMMIDITEKKLLEQKLELGRQRYAALVESSSDGIITVDQDQTIKIMNESARKIFGVTDDTMGGEHLSRFIPQRSRDKHSQHVDSFRKSDVNVRQMQLRSPVYGLRTDGSEVELEVTISKIKVGDEIEMTALIRDVSERTKLIEHLTQEAMHDSLTGIFNRRHGATVLNSEIQRCRRFGRELTVAMFDVDHFKGINDTYGHACGDLVLNSVVATISNSLREADAICRWGGDEFLVLLPETKIHDALHWAERARQAVASLAITGFGEEAMKVTASFGLAAIANKDSTPEELLWRADKALYRAKESGRNQVFVDPG